MNRVASYLLHLENEAKHIIEELEVRPIVFTYLTEQEISLLKLSHLSVISKDSPKFHANMQQQSYTQDISISITERTKNVGKEDISE